MAAALARCWQAVLASKGSGGRLSEAQRAARRPSSRQKSVFQACGAAALLADSSALAGLNLYCRDPLPVTSPPGGASSRTALPAGQML
jgi:hypothetical protein